MPLWIKHYHQKIGLLICSLIISFAYYIIDGHADFFTEDPYFHPFINSFTKWVLAISIIGNIAAYLWDLKKSMELVETEKKLKELEYSLNQEKEKNHILQFAMNDILSAVLITLSKALHFNKSDDRISLYAYDKNGDCFTLLARYSNNPNIKEKNGRTYSKAYGCISLTWDKGEYEITELPDYDSSPQAYIKESARYGVPEEIVKNMSMKARYYFGYRIKDTRGQDDLAVIVIESLQAKRFDKGYAYDILKNNHGDYLTQMLELVKDYIPQPSDAKSKGF